MAQSVGQVALDIVVGKDEVTGSNGVLSKLGSVASTAGKVAAAGIAAAGTAIVAVGKQAIGAFGEYEQLVGGVETLFKENADAVIENANRAFETAGMSANTYMQTVTSFSASLLQSLGGDTAEASKKADMAITDMADNANKMGTSIEMIQNAYQGFAKQNYTMLDNLKLGYGGTKGEMERLLEDASAISGIDYDIESYADVVDALHVIQTEIGITGTTAKEASGTIQGSISAMSASWSNLLVGLTDPTQDFDKLINNFVDSVGNVADNLVPRIGMVLDGITSLITKLAPKIIAEIPKLLSTLLPELINGAVSLVQAVVSAAPMIFNALIDMLPSILGAILEIFDEIVASLPMLIQSICSALPTLLPQLINGILGMIISLVNNIDDIVRPLLNALPDIIISVISALLENLPALIDGVISLVVGIANETPTIVQSLVDCIPTVISMLVESMIKNTPKILAGLAEIVWSIVKSIPSLLKSLWDSIVNTFKGIWDGIKAAFGGENGVGNWFKNIFGKAWEWIKGVFSSVGSFFSNVWGTIKNAFSSVGSWFKNIFKGAWDGIKSVFSGVGNFFSGIWNTIKSTFSTIGQKIGDAVSGAFKKAINWVLEKAVNLINGFINALNWCIGIINKIPGVNINNIGLLEVPKMEQGGVLKKGQVGLLEGNGAEAVVPLEKNTGWLTKIADMLNAKMGLNSLASSIRAAVSAPALNNVRAGTSHAEKNDGRLDRLIELLELFLNDQEGDITVPIYIGNELVDEYIINKNSRQLLRSGGHA